MVETSAGLWTIGRVFEKPRDRCESLELSKVRIETVIRPVVPSQNREKNADSRASMASVLKLRSPPERESTFSICVVVSELSFWKVRSKVSASWSKMSEPLEPRAYDGRSKKMLKRIQQ